MDPRYRFVVVIGFLISALWAGHVGWTLFNYTTLTLDAYRTQLMFLIPATFGGFGVVWLTASIIQWRKEPLTGFEPNASDEFGTVFEMVGPDKKLHPFKISLDKFLPQIIAPPSEGDISPLEAEILGFLNGYRHWPVDITQQNQGRNSVSLYEQSVARWHIMRYIPGAGPLHRVAALSKDIALIHAYKETRSPHNPPPFQRGYRLAFFKGLTTAWQKDTVRWALRCQPHGGVTSFVVSTFPALRAMAETPEGAVQQRALLTALRFHQTPNLLPLNAGPLAREILDYLWRADAQLQQLDVRTFDDMAPDQIQHLQDELATHWLGLLAELTPTGSPHAEMDAFRLASGEVWVRLGALLTHLGPLLRPELRQQLQLWVVDASQNPLAHPAWMHLSTLLQAEGLIANIWEGQNANNASFTLQLDGLVWGPAVLLKIDPLKHAPVLKDWQTIAGWAGTPEVVVDIEQLLARTQARVGDVDAQLANIF